MDTAMTKPSKAHSPFSESRRSVKGGKGDAFEYLSEPLPEPSQEAVGADGFARYSNGFL